jgi:hypothetical protein
LKGLKIAGTGAALAGTGLGIAGSLSAGTTVLGVGLGALGAVAGGVGALLAVPFALIQRHAQMVKLEDQTLCEISATYNAYAVKIEQALVSRQLTLAQAQAYIQEVNAQMQSALSGHVKNCNGYCYYVNACKALTLFLSEYVYPRMAPSPIASAIGGSVDDALGQAGIPATIAGFSTKTLLSIGGAALLVRKFF